MDDRWTLSVSELNEYVRKRLAGDPLLRTVEVTGEISNYKHHISGHRYFALKDEGARVACVMLRTQAEGLDFRPEDGMRVTVRASASIYVRDGSYQLYVNSMRLSGAGELYLRFETLKKKLAQEGLFDPARKQPIPLFPRVLGVATSEDGAAIRDILRVARARNPRIEIVLAPCAVQGASAAAEIVRAIERLNRDGRSEVILVGRGGGSLEDLWPFNEEIVARAIAASAIPVISCVGHEIDFTIADFVADVRAATPSNAAELAVPVVAEMREAVRQLGGRLGYALRARASSCAWRGWRPSGKGRGKRCRKGFFWNRAPRAWKNSSPVCCFPWSEAEIGGNGGCNWQAGRWARWIRRACCGEDTRSCAGGSVRDQRRPASSRRCDPGATGRWKRCGRGKGA